MTRSSALQAVESDSPAGRAGRGLGATGGSDSSHGIFFTCHTRWQGSHDAKRVLPDKRVYKSAIMINVATRPGLHFLLWRLGIAAARSKTTPAEHKCLQRHAANRCKLVEIGVWHGVTTRLLRSAMAPDGILFAIDPFPASRFGFSWEKQIAHGEVRREANGQVHFLEMTSAAAADHVRGSFEPLDFVFFDGDHSYKGLALDWSLWAPQVAPGGIIALHDTQSYPDPNTAPTESVRFTRETILADPRFAVLECVDSMTVLMRKS